MNGVTSIEVYGYANAGGGSAEPIVVTWNDYDLPSSGSGKSFTKDGVTITCGGIEWEDLDFYNGGTFTTDLGNFTKIEVYAGMVTTPLGEGWLGNSERQTWTGNASSVSFSGEFMSAGEEVNLTFTIEPAATPEPDSETLETNTKAASYTGTHFSVTPNAGQEGDSKGFFVTYTDHATISALNGETILSVELTVGDGEEYISYFGASKGNVSHSGSLITISEVNATSVELLMTYMSALQISQVKIYYAEAPEPEPAEVTVVFAANNKTVEKTVTLPHTFSCSYENKDGELDAIIKELYEISAGHCSDDNYPVASGNEAVLAGSNGSDNYITISAAFEGTATVSGSYWNSDAYDGDGDWMNYSLTISIKGDEPQPTAVENVQTNQVQAIKFFRDGQLLIVRDGVVYNVMGAIVK